MQTALFILGQLNDDDVERLIHEGLRHKYAAGEVLIRQGEPNEYLFIVLEGHVSISIAEIGAVGVAGSGEILGEMSMVESRPPSATATAVEDCYVLRLPYTKLRQWVQSDLGFGMRFYRALATVLSARLRRQGLADYNEEIGLLDDTRQKGELDANVLDSLHMAGERFDRLLKKMMTNQR